MKIRIEVWMEEDEKAAMEAVAKFEYLSLAAMIRKACRHYIAGHVLMNPEEATEGTALARIAKRSTGSNRDPLKEIVDEAFRDEERRKRLKEEKKKSEEEKS